MDYRCPQCGAALPQGVPAWARHLSVGHVMSRNPITLGPEESLMRALEVMRLHNIRRILIVMGDSLVGVLAEGDIKRAQPSILKDSEEEFNRIMEGTQISLVMINNPMTTTEDTPLVDAARVLQSTKFGALPVLRDGRVAGILTDTDLHTCLVELLKQGG
jgi:acetoin utilization protein AcuB